MNDPRGVPGAGNAGRPDKRRAARFFFWLSVGAAAAGALLLIAPFTAASWVLAIGCGLVCVVLAFGVLWRSREQPRSAFAWVASGFLLVAGIAAATFPEATARLLLSVSGAMLLGSGILALIVSAPFASRIPAALLPGGVMLAAGALIFAWPEAGIVVFAVVVGLISLLVSGMSFALWRRLRGPDDPSQTTIVV